MEVLETFGVRLQTVSRLLDSYSDAEQRQLWSVCTPIQLHEEVGCSSRESLILLEFVQIYALVSNLPLRDPHAAIRELYVSGVSLDDLVKGGKKSDGLELAEHDLNHLTSGATMILTPDMPDWNCLRMTDAEIELWRSAAAEIRDKERCAGDGTSADGGARVEALAQAEEAGVKLVGTARTTNPGQQPRERQGPHEDLRYLNDALRCLLKKPVDVMVPSKEVLNRRKMVQALENCGHSMYIRLFDNSEIGWELLQTLSHTELAEYGLPPVVAQAVVAEVAKHDILSIDGKVTRDNSPGDVGRPQTSPPEALEPRELTRSVSARSTSSISDGGRASMVKLLQDTNMLKHLKRLDVAGVEWAQLLLCTPADVVAFGIPPEDALTLIQRVRSQVTAHEVDVVVGGGTRERGTFASLRSKGGRSISRRLTRRRVSTQVETKRTNRRTVGVRVDMPPMISQGRTVDNVTVNTSSPMQSFAIVASARCVTQRAHQGFS